MIIAALNWEHTQEELLAVEHTTRENQVKCMGVCNTFGLLCVWLNFISASMCVCMHSKYTVYYCIATIIHNMNAYCRRSKLPPSSRRMVN